jgi:putative ABC transport system substrate-binding protein
MRRREVISLIAAATTWPLTARARQMPVIGYLIEGAEIVHMTDAFRQGLAEAGYLEGKNIAIEYRFVDVGSELLLHAAADLVQRNVNVIAAIGPAAAAAARNATTSISIVALDLESDPLAKGYAKSLAHPSGNLTGVFLDIPELSGKHVGLLKETVPRLSRVAIFGIPSLNAAQFAATDIAVRALALEAEIIEVRSGDDFARALESATTKHVEAGILLSSPSFSSIRSKSASLRWPSDFRSFPCSPSFQRQADSSLMDRM